MEHESVDLVQESAKPASKLPHNVHHAMKQSIELKVMIHWDVKLAYAGLDTVHLMTVLVFKATANPTSGAANARKIWHFVSNVRPQPKE